MDPALENILAISGKPFQAFPGQDHKAHIDAHLSFMSISMVQNNPMAMAGFTKKYTRTHFLHGTRTNSARICRRNARN